MNAKILKRLLHIPKKNYDVSKLDKFYPLIKQYYPSSTNALKLRKILNENVKNKKTSITYGCTDPCAVAHMSQYLNTIYVSGWQTASLCATDNVVGPDFADYPHDSVPKLVNRLFKAQNYHSTKYGKDIVSPIIADADTGHGGITSMMRMTHNFIEAGAAGIHIEDQRHGVKKCGHMGGKVLCSTREHLLRINAARMQSDIMEVPLVIIARTDAVDAKYIDTDIDERDHKHIKGMCEDGELRTLPDEIYRQFSSSYISQDDWKLKTTKRSWPHAAKKNFEYFLNSKSNVHSFDNIKREGVKALGTDFYWCHHHKNARSNDGFYSIKGSDEFAIERAINFGEYSDSVWIETSTPSLTQATYHATSIKEVLPDIPLSYNNSPSFNWDATNMTDEDMLNWTSSIAKLGYAWQFITLAGIHNIALNTHDFSKKYSKHGMLSYVQKIQRKEREANMDMLTHQKWSGANMSENIQSLLGANDTSSCSSDSTENQF
tara:strand:- start:6585 stop:8051 length:1467 start_codon:yes stop_codon:yes gene_type:complete